MQFTIKGLVATNPIFHGTGKSEVFRLYQICFFCPFEIQLPNWLFHRGLPYRSVSRELVAQIQGRQLGQERAIDGHLVRAPCALHKVAASAYRHVVRQLVGTGHHLPRDGVREGHS